VVRCMNFDPDPPLHRRRCRQRRARLRARESARQRCRCALRNVREKLAGGGEEHERGRAGPHSPRARESGERAAADGPASFRARVAAKSASSAVHSRARESAGAPRPLESRVRVRRVASAVASNREKPASARGAGTSVSRRLHTHVDWFRIGGLLCVGPHHCVRMPTQSVSTGGRVRYWARSRK
jgi:hypothetical protein